MIPYRPYYKVSFVKVLKVKASMDNFLDNRSPYGCMTSDLL